VSWDQRFAKPIVLPGGVKLASLREAIVHLVKTVPSSDRNMPIVLTAAELLTNAAEHGVPKMWNN
jgi:two-component sensor histidine kinase